MNKIINLSSDSIFLCAPLLLQLNGSDIGHERQREFASNEHHARDAERNGASGLQKVKPPDLDHVSALGKTIAGAHSGLREVPRRCPYDLCNKIFLFDKMLLLIAFDTDYDDIINPQRLPECL